MAINCSSARDCYAAAWALFALAAVALARPAEIVAQEKRNPVIAKIEAKTREDFKKLDVNGDGKVTADELVRTRRREYNKIQGAQKPGEVQIGRYMDHFGVKGKDVLTDLLFHLDLRQEFAKLDKNLDGKVNTAEYLSPAYVFIARFDMNADGEVTEQELVDNMTFKNPPRPPDMESKRAQAKAAISRALGTPERQ